MNREEYNKLSTYDKIDYDIQMELYQEFNDEIASINDHLGEIYGYSDLKDAEEAEMKTEIRKYQKALKDKCKCIYKAVEYIEEWQKFPHTNGTTHEELRNLKEILKGDSNESN